MCLAKHKLAYWNNTANEESQHKESSLCKYRVLRNIVVICLCYRNEGFQTFKRQDFNGNLVRKSNANWQIQGRKIMTFLRTYLNDKLSTKSTSVSMLIQGQISIDFMVLRNLLKQKTVTRSEILHLVTFCTVRS